MNLVRCVLIRICSAHLIVIGLLLIGCGPAASTDRSDPAAQSSDPSDELDLLNQRILESPQDISGYLDRARLLKDRGVLGSAFEDTRRALVLDSTSAEVHRLMGSLYYLDGQLGQAKYAYENALLFDGNDTESMLELAQIYLVLTNHDRAMEQVNRALRVDEQIPRAYLLKGLIYRELGNSDLVKSSLQTVTELDPEDAEAFNLLGMTYAEEGDTLALVYYDTSLDVDSMHKEALYNRSYFLQEQGRFERAIEGYELLLSRYPQTAVAHYNIGYIYLGMLGNLERAVDEFTEAIRSDPTYHQAYSARAVALEELGRIPAAIEDYERALEIVPDHSPSLDGLNRLR